MQQLKDCWERDFLWGPCQDHVPGPAVIGQDTPNLAVGKQLVELVSYSCKVPAGEDRSSWTQAKQHPLLEDCD
jgi:hypothetical protein